MKVVAIFVTVVLFMLAREAESDCACPCLQLGDLPCAPGDHTAELKSGSSSEFKIKCSPKKLEGGVSVKNVLYGSGSSISFKYKKRKKPKKIIITHKKNLSFCVKCLCVRFKDSPIVKAKLTPGGEQAATFFPGDPGGFSCALFGWIPCKWVTSITLVISGGTLATQTFKDLYMKTCV